MSLARQAGLGSRGSSVAHGIPTDESAKQQRLQQARSLSGQGIGVHLDLSCRNLLWWVRVPLRPFERRDYPASVLSLGASCSCPVGLSAGFRPFEDETRLPLGLLKLDRCVVCAGTQGSPRSRFCDSDNEAHAQAKPFGTRKHRNYHAQVAWRIAMPQLRDSCTAQMTTTKRASEKPRADATEEKLRRMY